MEIKLCERCGKVFTGFGPYARYCWACIEENAREENVRLALEGEDIEYADSVFCPWCGHETSSEYMETREYFEDGSHLMHCGSCGKHFSMDVDVTIKYSTSRKLARWMEKELESRERRST